jgi:hypothetical protein
LIIDLAIDLGPFTGGNTQLEFSFLPDIIVELGWLRTLIEPDHIPDLFCMDLQQKSQI